MELFFRYISYVDYYDNGNRIKNVGFLRWKFQNAKHDIEIQLKDVLNLRGTFQILEVNSSISLGNINMDQGIGTYRNSFSSYHDHEHLYLNLEYQKLYLDKITGFQIKLNNEKYLYIPVHLPINKSPSVIKDELKEETMNVVLQKNSTLEEFSDKKNNNSIPEEFSNKNTNISTMIPDNSAVSKDADITKDTSDLKDIPIPQSETLETEAAAENIILDGIESKYIPEMIPDKSIKMQVTPSFPTPKSHPQNIEILEPLHEDKWLQLCKKYSNVHPFKNGKVFLSIKPEDFIILQQGYQKLVHNSFLLHGFYNYGHLILGKLDDGTESPFYIGVPGVYYNQEKKAAQMFGFVGFESTEQPVQPGSYGYYMIEVML